MSSNKKRWKKNDGNFCYSYRFSWALFYAIKLLETVCCFQVLLLRRLGTSETEPSLRLILPHYWGKTFLSILSTALGNKSFSCLLGGSSHCFQPAISTVSVPSFDNSFLGGFLTRMRQFPWGSLCRSLELAVCAALSSLELSPVNSRCPGLPGLSFISSRWGTYLSSASLHRSLGTVSSLLAGATVGLTSFPIPQRSPVDSCILLFKGWQWWCFRQWIHLIPVIPLWPESTDILNWTFVWHPGK